jgi:APA family basic amino acid/polyamine antiporter
MALKNALPDSLAKLHPVHGTPYLSIWIVGLLMALLAVFVDLESVVAASTFGQLFYYSLANISDIKLRMQRNDNLVLPALGAVSCLALLAFLLFAAPYAWALGMIQVAIGGIYYMLRRR